MSRHALILTAALLTPAACTAPPAPSAPGAAAVFAGASGRWVDLTHPFSSSSIYWPTANGFVLDTVAFGQTEGGWFYSAFDFRAAEHGGTHLDAPIHFAEGRMAADEIPLSQLIGAAAVVDLSERAGPDDQVQVADLEAWEARHGRLPDGVILLLRTGWGNRYGDRSAYLGTDVTGPEAVPLLHFPGLHPDAARWLVAERAVGAVGIDTPSIDHGQSATFESHQILYGADIPGFENVAGLEQLPEQGAFVVALPMKIEGGSGGPLRIVAFVPERT
ncbi:MAG: cyclase family protein [Gemmatimonadota bacterium]